MVGTDYKPMQQVASETSADRNEQATYESALEAETLNREQLQIMNWIKEVRFRRQLFGGVNEQDVWKKIEKLNEMYEAALKAERIRYDVLLEQQKGNERSDQSDHLAKDTTVDD